MNWQRIAVQDDATDYQWPPPTDVGATWEARVTPGWYVVCDWPKQGRQGPEVSLSVRHRNEFGKVVVVAPTRRLTLASSSGFESLGRMVRGYWRDHTDQSDDPVSMLAAIVEDQQALFKHVDPAVVPDYEGRVSRNRKGAWVLRPFWAGSGATAVIAGGGTGKSFLAQACAMSVASGVTMLQRNTFNPDKKRVLYLDFESDEDTFVDRAVALSDGFGLPIDEFRDNLLYMQCGGLRLTDVMDKARHLIATQDVDAVVVDSMSASVGEGGLIDDTSVNSYWDSIMRLRVPTLVVVHKSAANVEAKRMRAFGSIMTENRLRMAWDALRNESGQLLLRCFKDNNMGRVGSALVYDHAIEGDDEFGYVTKSSFFGISQDSWIPDEDDGTPTPTETVWDKVVGYLSGTEKATTTQIAEAIGTTAATLRSKRKVNDPNGEIVHVDGSNRWSLA